MDFEICGGEVKSRGVGREEEVSLWFNSQDRPLLKHPECEREMVEEER